MKECASCGFYQSSIHRPAGGECRRHTPVIISFPESQQHQSGYETMFPEVMEDEWCGEYAAAVSAKASEEKPA